MCAGVHMWLCDTDFVADCPDISLGARQFASSYELSRTTCDLLPKPEALYKVPIVQQQMPSKPLWQASSGGEILHLYNSNDASLVCSWSTILKMRIKTSS